MRIRSLLLSLAATTAVLALGAAAQPFSDIAGHPYANSIVSLRERGVVAGYANGTFKPNASINRAELLQILINAGYGNVATPENLRCFADLDAPNPQWYARAVCLGRALGIVQGYSDNRFRPEQTVNLAEALKMTTLALHIDVPALQPGQAWYAPYVTAARNRGILPGLLPTPSHLLTRGEMAEIVNGFLTVQGSGQTPGMPAVCGNGKLERFEQCDDGNMQDSDGCSSICVIVPEPVRHALLQIEQKASGSVSGAAQGRKNVPLLLFTAVSGRQNVILNSVTFAPTAGTLLYGQHYTLSADLNGDGSYETVLQTDAAARADRVRFDWLKGAATSLPQGRVIKYQVSADLPATNAPVTIGLRFATEDSDYVEATGAVDGLPLTGIQTDNVCNDRSLCMINVYTTASVSITIQSRGNLYVTADSSPVRSHQAIAGSITDELLRLRMRAENEDIDVSLLRIEGGTNDIDALLFYKVSPGQRPNLTGQPLAQATTGQCSDGSTTAFCARLSQRTLVLKADEDVVIAVAARMKNDQSGGASGHSFQLWMDASTGIIHAIEANGISSSQTLSQNDGNSVKDGEIFIGTTSASANAGIAGPTHDTALAGFRSIVNGRFDGPTITGIPAGTLAFASFRFTALAHNNSFGGLNDVVMKTLIFHVTAQNVLLDQSSFKLFENGNPTITMSCSSGAATGSFDVSCINIDGSMIRSRIGQSEDVTYALSATVLNPQMVQGSSLLMAELSNLGSRGGASSVAWSDDATTFIWVDVPFTSVGSVQYRQ
jgi:cysteine-rich repeat protein